jgi:hypothetical protein|tara:strand:- start:523 stop:723 length:201 start_codon:yes stop_codon:yes gene_type:complete
LTNNGVDGILTDKTKFRVTELRGTAAEVQAAFIALVSNDDVVMGVSTSRVKDSNDIILTVVWYDVA